MNPEELSIGNWILIEGRPSKIDYIDCIVGGVISGDQSAAMSSIEDVQPIPLAREVLHRETLREGSKWRLTFEDGLNKDFELISRSGFRLEVHFWGKHTYIYIVRRSDTITVAEKEEAFPIHRLQNLWLSFTGEDLGIHEV